MSKTSNKMTKTIFNCCYCLVLHVVGNKAKGQISKQLFQK